MSTDKNNKPSSESQAPKWITESLFEDLLKKNLAGFSKIKNFKTYPALAPGDNYSTVMLRVEIIAELEDDKTKSITYMLKVPFDMPIYKQMLKKNNIFKTEAAVYQQIVPEMEKAYQDVGIEVKFGADNYIVDVNEDYVLLEDLRPRGFKNANRLEGLDLEHTKCVLKKLALWHAGTATRIETKGKYSNINTNSYFEENQKPAVTIMLQNTYTNFCKCLDSYKGHELYKEAVLKLCPKLIDRLFELSKPDSNEFNVLNHGDCWSNNIMFQYDAFGKIKETYFVDLQLVKYGSPVQDLLYFLLTSTKFELKLNQFDYFIKFYHDHLIENLKLLKYPKKLPALKDLHGMLYKYGVWGFATVAGTMAGALLDPNENASLENLIADSAAGEQFKLLLYSNARYRKHIEATMPWLYYRGALDL